MANPHFWSDISVTPYQPGMALVDVCLQRIKSSPPDISLNVYAMVFHQDFLCDPVFFALAPHTIRWRSLHLIFVDARGYAGSSRIFKRMQGTSYPILESVTGFHDRWNNCESLSNRRMDFLSSWNVPSYTSVFPIRCHLQQPSPLSTSVFPTVLISSGSSVCSWE